MSRNRTYLVAYLCHWYIFYHIFFLVKVVVVVDVTTLKKQETSEVTEDKSNRMRWGR